MRGFGEWAKTEKEGAKSQAVCFILFIYFVLFLRKAGRRAGVVRAMTRQDKEGKVSDMM